jgi:hypothetical protein
VELQGSRVLVRWALGALPALAGRIPSAPFPNRACTFRYAPGSP